MMNIICGRGIPIYQQELLPTYNEISECEGSNYRHVLNNQEFASFFDNHHRRVLPQARAQMNLQTSKNSSLIFWYA